MADTDRVCVQRVKINRCSDTVCKLLQLIKGKTLTSFTVFGKDIAHGQRCSRSADDIAHEGETISKLIFQSVSPSDYGEDGILFKGIRIFVLDSIVELVSTNEFVLFNCRINNGGYVLKLFLGQIQRICMEVFTLAVTHKFAI